MSNSIIGRVTCVLHVSMLFLVAYWELSRVTYERYLARMQPEKTAVYVGSGQFTSNWCKSFKSEAFEWICQCCSCSFEEGYKHLKHPSNPPLLFLLFFLSFCRSCPTVMSPLSVYNLPASAKISHDNDTRTYRLATAGTHERQCVYLQMWAVCVATTASYWQHFRRCKNDFIMSSFNTNSYMICALFC